MQDMEGMHRMSDGMGLTAWSPAFLWATFAMWSVMMVAMMLPSALPMVRLFVRSSRRSASAMRATLLTGTFVAGYLLVWTAFSAGAALLQALLRSRALLGPEMSLQHPWLAAAVLLVAGVYQFTRLKHACLSHCQSPLEFILTQWREGARGAMSMGLRHGLYCVGCCWALMLVLFAVGVMSLGWVMALATFVLIEKTLVRKPWLSRVAGVALAGGAATVLMRQVPISRSSE